MDARATADTTPAPTAKPAEPIPPPEDGVPIDDMLSLMLPTVQALYRREDHRLKILSEVMTAAASGLVVVREIVAIAKRSPILPIYTERTDL
jgi:hypothetical protein